MLKKLSISCFILAASLSLNSCKNNNPNENNKVAVKDKKISGTITEQGYLEGKSMFRLKNSDIFPLPQEVDSSKIMYIKINDEICSFPMSVGLRYGLVTIAGKLIFMHNIDNKVTVTLNYMNEIKGISSAEE